MRHEIINGDVLDGLRSLPDCSVQCVVTSPPYWGLRDYGVPGQIGLEPTLDEYVEKMVGVFREVWRVLRNDGTVWLNLGDSYASARACGRRNVVGSGSLEDGKRDAGPNRPVNGLREKNLVGIPWRVAFALQADGWYLRSDIIWSKPNPMPESVRDRPTKSHEYVFLLTKRPRYFYDADAVREKIGEPVRMAASFRDGGVYTNNRSYDNQGPRQKETHGDGDPSFVGRNRRTVWKIATQPTSEAHFATFPEALVIPCIKAGTSERGCCPECGAPWRRVVEREVTGIPHYNSKSKGRADCQYGESATTTLRATARNAKTVCWQPSCTCDVAETVPCVVLDPFGGSGTVAKVARDLGRSSVMIELNPEYVGIMKKRLRVGGQLDSDVNEIHVTSLPLTDGGVV
ncbi:MAG: site-specific DNA-methyltransferase [Candidatus Nanoarchaeia archaeon]|nr:site-specific DNA-methyltransferase [Candidatus Nanoarchaeia archaeon]